MIEMNLIASLLHSFTFFQLSHIFSTLLSIHSSNSRNTCWSSWPGGRRWHQWPGRRRWHQWPSCCCSVGSSAKSGWELSIGRKLSIGGKLAIGGKLSINRKLSTRNRLILISWNRIVNWIGNIDYISATLWWELLWNTTRRIGVWVRWLKSAATWSENLSNLSPLSRRTADFDTIQFDLLQIFILDCIIILIDNNIWSVGRRGWEKVSKVIRFQKRKSFKSDQISKEIRFQKKNEEEKEWRKRMEAWKGIILPMNDDRMMKKPKNVIEGKSFIFSRSNIR